MDRNKTTTSLDLVQVVDGWPYFQKGFQAYKDFMADYYYFMIEGYEQPFGYIRKAKVEQIVWPDYWKVDHDDKLLTLSSGSGIEDRNEYMGKTLQQIHEKGEVSELRKLSDEMYGIQGPHGEAVLIMNRSAAGMFGIRTYGVFLIAYVQTDEGKKFWVAQRSQTKMTYPGKLDMCVGGSLRAQEAPIDCLVREGEEEASLPADYTRKWAQLCGALTYHMSVNDSGKPASRAQTQYVYEIVLPTDMVPKPCDGEVEGFKLMTLEEVRDALFRKEFKLNIAMTWMDYLIRHGHMHAENEESYLEICARLHRNLDFFVA